jgi:uncharacterized protein YdeI (YjbR/CyaY-like superfamily)
VATLDPRVDAYIERSADFAKPILSRLREVVHAACPAVEESMKWSHPHFGYRGMLCGMAAFKGHAAFGFWKHTLVVGDAGKPSEAMGDLGRLTAVGDLPSKAVLTRWVRTAMELNEKGVKAVKKKTAPRKAIPTPKELTAALAKNAKARATFEAFSPSCRREYVEWIVEAKGADTKQRRLDTTIEWLGAGKKRNWKYENC